MRMNSSRARRLQKRSERKSSMDAEHHQRVDASTAQRTNLAPLYNRNKLAMWFFLGGEIILFATLISTFALARITFAAQYPGFRSQRNIPLIGLNTFVLLTSSYFVVRTLEAARQRRQNAMLVN